MHWCRAASANKMPNPSINVFVKYDVEATLSSTVDLVEKLYLFQCENLNKTKLRQLKMYETNT